MCSSDLDVKRITAENLAKVKNPPPRPFPWAPLAIGVTVVSLGAYGALWLARWRRNRFRIRPSEVAKLIEASPPPVILDVRDRSTYDKSPVRIANARHVPPDQLETSVVALAIAPERTVVAYCT